MSDDAKPPVFTIGHRETYTLLLKGALADGGVILKQGMGPGYGGGIIFQNPKDARRYINEEIPAERRNLYAVFEVAASWEHDCYLATPENYWKHLATHKPIICMVID